MAYEVLAGRGEVRRHDVLGTDDVCVKFVEGIPVKWELSADKYVE